MLQENRVGKVFCLFFCGGGGGRGGVEKEGKTICTVVNEEIPQEGKQLRSSRECNNLTELSNDKSRDEEGDGTSCKICTIPWIEVTEKCGDWFQCNICDKYTVDSLIKGHTN